MNGKIYDAAAKYNLGHLNNAEAIGYRNLEARAADLANNTDIAHESVFDQMLAEYFLQKRGEYKDSNKLLTDMEKMFGLEDHPIGPQEERKKTLGEAYMRQTWNKSDQAELLPYNLPALMELDIAVNKQLNGGLSGISNELREFNNVPTEIPEYFDLMDVRKPADKYVKETLRSIMDELFEARRNLEKHLSRRELIAYDQVLSKFLKPDVLMAKLKRRIAQDKNSLSQQNQMADHFRDSKASEEKQTQKTKNTQPLFNKDIANEDALYKFLAFSGQLERKRRENREQTLDDPTIVAGFEGFESFYQDTLLQDAKKAPRPIDTSLFKAKAQVSSVDQAQDVKAHVYLDERGRRDQFLDEHKLYKENKLEQQERIELFYVLEQLNKKPKDPMAEASRHLEEYFSKPENTFFYEKNKI